MKAFLFTVLALFATSAFADNLVLTCAPGAELNGLRFAAIDLKIDNENPEAEMTVLYEGKSVPEKSQMDYTATTTEYVLTPQTGNDGLLSVNLKNQNGIWTATVFHAYMDTFSVLDCQEYPKPISF